jgi:hypothetical protein
VSISQTFYVRSLWPFQHKLVLFENTAWSGLFWL